MVGCLHHLDEPVRARAMGELLDLFDLTSVRGNRLTEFSKGMKQKVVIAAALLHKPDVLSWTSRSTASTRTPRCWSRSCSSSSPRQRRTILFCSHILDVVERICTRIVIVDKGWKIAEGTAADIMAQTGAASLELAFSQLTGGAEPGAVTADFLAALERQSVDGTPPRAIVRRGSCARVRRSTSIRQWRALVVTALRVDLRTGERHQPVAHGAVDRRAIAVGLSSCRSC